MFICAKGMELNQTQIILYMFNVNVLNIEYLTPGYLDFDILSLNVFELKTN